MDTHYEVAHGATASAGRGARVLVWDWPTRLGHWLMAGSFALAWLTSEGEAWQKVHLAAGYTFGALLLFRLAWGLVGTRYARFAQFVKSPRAAWHYLTSLLSAAPQHHTGHNPAGAWAILALLGLGAVTVASGWANFNELGGEWLEEVHEALASLMLGVVVVHLAGVLIGSLAHRENLARAMLDGYKQGQPGAGIRSPRAWAGALLLAWVTAAVVVML